MIELTQFTAPATLAILIALAIQVVKPWIENKRAIPLFAIGLGVAFSVLIALVLGQAKGSAGVLSAVLGGTVSGLLAVGGFETLLKGIKQN